MQVTKKPFFAKKIFLLNCLFFMSYFFATTVLAEVNGSSTFMAIGPYHFGKPILLQSKDGANAWTIISFPNLSVLERISCTGNSVNPVCALTGFSQGQPLLLALLTHVNDWREVKLQTPFREFEDVHCSGVDSNAFCLAIGRNNVNNSIIAYGSQGNHQWQFKYNETYLKFVDCAGNYPNGICIASIGNDNNTLGISLDSGNTWQQKITMKNFFSRATCTAQDSEFVCVAVSGTTIAVYNKAWSTPTIENYPYKEGDLSALTCFYKSKNASCVAGGKDVAGFPLLVATQDGGQSWQYKPICGLIGNGEFTAVSCTAKICIAVGYKLTGKQKFPLIAVSHDSGKSWRESKLKQTFPGKLNDVKCSDHQGKTVCVAGGSKNEADTLLLISQDESRSWEETFTLPVHSGEITKIVAI